MANARNPGALVPALTVFLALVLLWAVGSRLWNRRRSPVPPATIPTVTQPAGVGDTTAAAGRVAAAPGSAAAAARAAARELIRREAAGTYIVETLEETDSVLRRWPDRLGRPVRVAVVRGAVRDWTDDYFRAANWAVSHWNIAGLPVRFATGFDSATADIVIVWVDSLGGLREGRADLTWNGRGEMVRAVLLLAAHAPGGRRHTTPEMMTLALHEFGHAIGLGHSTDSADVLFPINSTADLSARDRRTAALLYSLPTGSVKN